jgi:histidinol dehydrogenase
MLRIINDRVEMGHEIRRLRDREPLWWSQSKLMTHDAQITIEAIETRGDQALLEQAAAITGQKLPLEALKISGSELDAAYQQISKDLLTAIRFICQQLRSLQKKTMPQPWVRFEPEPITIGQKFYPLDSLGLYIGNQPQHHLANLLILGTIAESLGIKRVVLCLPLVTESRNTLNPALLVTAQELGIHEIYRSQDLSAITAMVSGTETIKRVAMVTGVTDVFSILYQQLKPHVPVRFNTLRTNHNLIMVSDGGNSPAQIVGEMLAQGEIHPQSANVLITHDVAIAEQIQTLIKAQLKNLSASTAIEKAIANYGLIFCLNDLEESIPLITELKPELLHLAIEEPWDRIKYFDYPCLITLGYHTPLAISQYLCNNHKNFDLVQEMSLLEYGKQALQEIAPHLMILAQTDGFEHLAHSLKLRVS